MGIIGTLDNAGKVIGPVLGGLLIARFDYAITFDLLGGFLLLGALLIGVTSIGAERGTQTAVMVRRLSQVRGTIPVHSLAPKALWIVPCTSLGCRHQIPVCSNHF